MKRSKYDFWIEAEGAGFFGIPSFADDYRPPEDFEADPSLACAYAIDRAKKGDFSYVPGCFEFYGTTGRPIVDSMVLGLFAYAGPGSCFARIVEIVDAQDNLGRSLDLCGVLAERGELSYVSIFLRKYLENIRSNNAEYMIDYISEILGDSVRVLDPDEYDIEIDRLYNLTAGRIGPESALVFQGEPYNVGRLARYILDQANRPHFRSTLRRSFEAATGIDCGSWYRDGRFRPLAASAILEEFLESPEAAKYEDGVRYFFGHRIPD